MSNVSNECDRFDIVVTAKLWAGTTGATLFKRKKVFVQVVRKKS